ncbi:Eukaryotic elongation factor-2 kinase [Puccinia graminis f. sp. tritici]|uniref:Eukaryotic elongation factor-2 kinase n=1 Tax=Puccinia graminis f. sp. tritici TaxID=56615 RepID=A0A5B0MR38_PUCGR|nr:Eukaryotic elongation factor-2 kinase [Puccinia graminis f. sp. tritici]
MPDVLDNTLPGIAKELHGVKNREASATQSSRASTSRTPDPKQSPEKRFVKAGVTVYIDDQPQKKTGIIPKVLEVDTKKPNFYEDLRHHLWTLFYEEILAKTKITFPPDPEQYTCLGTLNSKIENHGTLLDLSRTGKTIKSAAVINLFYQHPIKAFPDTVLPTTRENVMQIPPRHPNLPHGPLMGKLQPNQFGNQLAYQHKSTPSATQ